MNPSFFYALSLGGLLFVGAVACKKDKEAPADAAFTYTTVSTLAGNGMDGFVDGSATAAQFFAPEGAVVDAQGNVYVADYGNSSIRKITPSGMVSTLAGNGMDGFVNGSLSTAQFNSPADVALDGQGNLYVADTGNDCLRKITPGGVVSTFAGTGVAGFADGGAATAQFNGPRGLVVDGQGVLYVSDDGNHRIRKVLPNGTVSTVAGTGSRALFASPEGLALDGQGNLFVADFAGQRILKISPNGAVSTLAGTGVRGYADGAGNTAQFNGVAGVALDAHGDLFVADAYNYCVRKVTPAGVVSTVAGTRAAGFADGPAAAAQFRAPSGIAVGGKGILYVTEYGERIRKITSN